MMKLADAVTHRFPQQNEWATRALASLTDQLADDTPVHELVEGWLLVGADQNATLIDVLFVLTETRLGIGHAGDLQIERWIDLASIVVVDAIDNSLYPLQTIEMQFADGAPLTLGWPHPFSDQFVAVLVRLRDAAAQDPAAEPAAPAVAPGAPAVAPGAPAVAPAAPAVAPAAPLGHDAAPSGPRPALGALLESAPQNKVAETDRDEVLAALGLPPAAMSEEAAAKHEAATETFFGDLDHEPEQPVEVPKFGDDPRAPWEIMGNAWPDEIVSVNYLGGHPSVKRKKKSGVMSFSPEGLRVRGTGVGRWDMTIEWPHMVSMDVQGPDEIMFAEALRVAASSCVVVVEMTEGSRLFFEVMGRRPPSLRSEIAAVISMVDAGRTYRPATSDPSA